MTKRYFIARVERQRGTAPNDKDVPIAPILPGRYAVIGSSGMQLTPGGGSTPNTYQPGQLQRFVTPVSRLRGSAREPEQTDPAHRMAMANTRRIELWPSVDPRAQQLLVAQNGGQEIVSLGGGNYVNVTDSNGDGKPDSTSVIDTNGDGRVDGQDSPIVDPAVAIPVEDLNISEPLEGYPSLRYQLIEQNQTAADPNANRDPTDVQEARLNQDGEWEYEIPYDRPFDLDLELVRNGTTQNYRSVHLQRLANPTLPWNPPPVDEEGKPNVLHQVNLPINPYLTIDSQSVDLTAFNGASEYERTELPTAAAMQNLRGMNTRDLLQSHYFAPLSPSEFKTAPDHVVQGLINELVEKRILPQRGTQWVTVEEFRKYTEDRIKTYLDRLEEKKGGNVDDRATLLDPTFGGEWGWHRLRRAMPDDAAAEAAHGNNYREESFKQRLHMKSQERGAHHLAYDFDPDEEGWDVDSAWEPRLLWKQERPNVTLIFRTGTQEKMLSDLENVWSGRVLLGRLGPIDSQPTDPQRDPMITLTQDERDRAAWLKANLTIDDDNKQHVFDYVMEQTLGFVNEAYAPNLDR
ncbi:MAG TPA: hypothetical protein VGK58_00005, partial [Lacipirellulaceae bacterium]